MLLPRFALPLAVIFLILPVVSAQEISESYRNALVAYKTGQYAEAASQIEKSIAETPKEARPLLLRGRINTALKHYDSAEKDLRSALKLDHSSSIGYFYLGDLFYVQKKFDLARIHYTTYHHQVPDDLDATLQLVYCALGVSDLGEAQRLANTLDFFNEKNPAAYFATSAIDRIKDPTKPTSAPNQERPRI